MEYADIFARRIEQESPDEVFQYLVATLRNTVTGWDYFVNWAKVFDNIRDIEVDLNTLNYLVGKDDIEREFVVLLDRHPQLARLIPVLIACREKQFEILTDFNSTDLIYETFDFGRPGAIAKERVVEFARSSGFLSLLQSKRIKSLVDYVIGVEVGLDSNGRKNRGGDCMETIVELFVKDICARHQLRYMRQATSARVRRDWGLVLSVDKSSRRVDFAVNNAGHLFLIETNFYGGGGSKLKSTAGEYRTMFDFWKRDGHEFIWITDGAGWRNTQHPLRETFDHTDCVLNLAMVAKGVLEDILAGPARA